MGLLGIFFMFRTLYLIVNIYICYRGFSLFPKKSWLKKIYIIIFALLALPFMLGRTLRDEVPGALTDFLTIIGSYWFAIILYLFIAVLFVDALRITNHFKKILPNLFFNNVLKTRRIIAAIIIFIVTIAIIYGRINANNVIVKTVPITIEKKAKNLSSLKVLLISDIHLGLMVQNAELSRIVELSNQQEADIVLLAGDIFDAKVEPVRAFNANKLLSAFKSKYGTYAVLGNHEYIGEANEAVEYLTASGITVLRDTAVLIDNSFYIAGRDDFSSSRRNRKARLPLEQIITGLDHTKPILLMDHQPKDLGLAAKCKVDLQVSGHTHGGQIWPFNYIVQLMWEVTSGYTEKDNTKFYVTKGAGTWGPRIRVGIDPEIVVINIDFLK